MPSTTRNQLEQAAQQAGYHVHSVEQLRPNRFLLTLRDDSGSLTLVLAQSRHLIGAADVNDLADVARLRRPAHSILLAVGGTFSAAAKHAADELNDVRALLCTTLPPAHRAESRESTRPAPAPHTAKADPRKA